MEQQKNNKLALGENDTEKATEVGRSDLATGYNAKPGLTKDESDEWDTFLKMQAGEVTQEDWNRFFELNDKYLSALIEEWRKNEAI